MGRISSIYGLQKDHRDELETRLHDAGYGRLDEHVEWLQGLGYDVSRSAIHRYVPAAKSINQVRERLRAAGAAACAVLDESGVEVGAAARAMLAEALFRKTVDEELSADALHALAESVARLSGHEVKERQLDLSARRVELQQERLQLEKERRRDAAIQREAAAASAERAEAVAVSKGVSPEGIAALRAAIMEGA
ncbi:phage protein Gp27 family protein [Thiocystis violascens]|uniref:DUF3486 family protein n=1 Tax=Thiocystis violascens (strain ATCC 17096 / DSM 198 / 6111) TaxID=765911 RepID=I3YEG7_THIV6|nr:phage protein Gp27 family protein [Thiocystis violascens]AFL75385.1 Protein of unknown function (DUF3486) [Thiocystis violascens DSM 198]